MTTIDQTMTLGDGTVIEIQNVVNGYLKLLITPNGGSQISMLLASRTEADNVIRLINAAVMLLTA